MKRKVIVWMLCILAVAGMLFAIPAFAADEAQAYTAVATADELLAALESGYAYVQLGADVDVELSGQELVVDLAGYNLNVSGSGNVKAFDTANDTFDHTLCGTLTCQDSVTCSTTFTAPTEDAFFYIRYGGSGRYTFHRMDMKITNVVFRPSVAGVYYKAYFACDRLMEESVKCYGVAARTGDTVPGKTFRSNAKTYTENTGLISGTTVNSGIIADILRDVTAEENKASADTVINARLYIELVDQGIVMAPTYAATSLNSLLTNLDSSYSKLAATVQNQLDDFHDQWASKTTGWSFKNIGAEDLDFDAMNANLSFDEGTTKAKCYKCGIKVTWTAVSDESTLSGTNGSHYYLADDLEYTGSTDAFISTGSGTSCLHLNGHNITATNTKYVFWIGSGRMNVMGQGIVTGESKAEATGAAIHGNNKNANNGIYLYGGTYTKSAASSSAAPVIGMGVNGRNINIFEQATVDAGTGTALYIDGSSDSRDKEGYVGLFGCTINGDVKLLNLGTYANNVSVVDATINGTLNVPVGHRVYLQGSPKITNLSVSDGATVITSGLKDGADIGVTAVGYFTGTYNNLADYADYFSAVNAKEGVFVRNNKLYCGKDYVSDLKFINADGDDSTNDAYCPVCGKDAIWVPLDQAAIDAHEGGTSYFYTLTDGSETAGNYHFYLTGDITYTGEASVAFMRSGGKGYVSCLHLNGHNITATKRTAFYSNSGVLNVMGSGKVTGLSTSSTCGGAITSNNENENSSMNFFSGDYYSSDPSKYAVRMRTAGGRIYFYEDAVIHGGAEDKAVYLPAITGGGVYTVLNIQGTTVDGNVSVNGVSGGNVVTLTLDGATVKGTVKAAGTNNVRLLNDVKIDLLDASAASMIDLTDGTTDGETIGSGSFVTVQNAGAFAYAFDGADDYVNCFRTAWRDDKIVIRDNALTYKPNYEMGLQYNSEGKARCPICQDYYTWTAITDAASITEAGHYYLSGDLSFAEAADAVAHLVSSADVCLHLNGYDVTADQSPAIGITDGVLNVMGDGTVLGNSAVFADSASADSAVMLYGGSFKKTASEDNAVLTFGNGGSVWVFEDAKVDSEDTGLAANVNAGALMLDSAVLAGGVAVSEEAVFDSNNSTVAGAVQVNNNNATFTGLTVVDSLEVADGCLVDFADLSAGSSIKVQANGAFTAEIANADAWQSYFKASDSANWVIVRGDKLQCSEKQSITSATADEITKLEADYAGLEVKYGEMHNHTSAGLSADGRRTLAEWKERMVQLNMSFATIVDHKQVAHMYHKDWQTAPTEEYDVVFVGGSEPATEITDLSASATRSNMHYNMITGDPEELLDVVRTFTKFSLSEKTYTYYNAPTSWSYSKKYWENEDGVLTANNKNKDYNPDDFTQDPDEFLERFSYPDWSRAEFESLTEAIYDTGGLLVQVHPKGSSYIASDDPMDYCFSGDAGTGDSTVPAMGFEIHTAGYGNNPSRALCDAAYQTWVDMLKLGKKVYATYGDDGHRMPTALALTTVYAPDGADSEAYLNLMHTGNIAPGWVGIRMEVTGDTAEETAHMGGETDFAGKRLVFSIGDMYQPNAYSKTYVNKGLKNAVATWEPGYDESHTYIAQLYDDRGLLMESEIKPGDSEMDYFAIDADETAKYYRIVIWDMTQNYRCGVSNPIWNTNVVSETAE